jgi:energy-coupling factor transporter ATP-binding protein EcfA2
LILVPDEPTSGLDAAAASNIMQEIVRVAKEERIIIVCTIHQPSTKVYNGFDQLMIMSRGRQAFSGDVKEAIPHFESIGYPCPPATNPAEVCLRLCLMHMLYTPMLIKIFVILFCSSFSIWSTVISRMKRPSRPF